MLCIFRIIQNYINKERICNFHSENINELGRLLSLIIRPRQVQRPQTQVVARSQLPHLRRSPQLNQLNQKVNLHSRRQPGSHFRLRKQLAETAPRTCTLYP